MKKIDEFLSKKAKSPTPYMYADPFLPVKIASMVQEREKRKIIVLPGWSFTSIIATCAILIGIYLGMGIMQDNTSSDNVDIVSEYSEAFYQNGFVDNYNYVLENGDIEK